MGSTKFVALVIGASRGIGRQIAIDLAKDGYSGISLHSFAIDMVIITKYPHNSHRHRQDHF